MKKRFKEIQHRYYSGSVPTLSFDNTVSRVMIQIAINDDDETIELSISKNDFPKPECAEYVWNQITQVGTPMVSKEFFNVCYDRFREVMCQTK